MPSAIQVSYTPGSCMVGSYGSTAWTCTGTYHGDSDLQLERINVIQLHSSLSFKDRSFLAMTVLCRALSHFPAIAWTLQHVVCESKNS